MESSETQEYEQACDAGKKWIIPNSLK